MEKQNNFNILSDKLKKLIKIELYSINTIKNFNFILNLFLNYMIKNKLTEYTPAIGVEFTNYCEKDLQLCQSRVALSKNVTRKFNRLLEGFDNKKALISGNKRVFTLSPDYDRAIAQYIEYCQNIGNSSGTIYQKHRACNIVLEKLVNKKCTCIKNISGHLLQEVFLELESQKYWEKVKPFFHYLFEHGKLNKDYSKLIAYRKKKSIYPTVYSTEEIAIIENSVVQDTATGIRNYAIILLMSRYGIRPCDVASLTFENVDFYNNRLHFIQQKTGEPWEAELIPDVKKALVNYINKARPKSINSTRIFFTLSNPIRPISYLTIATMVGDLISKSGIDISNRRHGCRIFRSSIASNMIKDNTPTEVVRRVLGHSTKYAIKHYAKLDITALKLCALEVPQPSGIFAKKLYETAGEKHV